MKIYVCVKHVPDSAATIEVIDGKRINTGITFLINPYDEHALTEAARLCNGKPDAEIVAICLGPPEAESTLRSAMAMGAHRAILVSTPDNHDSMFTARALHAAISRDGEPAMILAGKESIDQEGMQTPFRLARLFNMPVAANVVSVKLETDTVLVECEKEAGAVDVVRMALPCVLGAGKALNTPRYPTFPDIVKSRKKPLDVIALDALQVEPPPGGMRILSLEPVRDERRPRQLEGSPAEIAHQLMDILKNQARVI
ncbi:MAG: electron transfer flavoprotein subunit beta/FixA family protein [Desulfosarcinaceae bacterium]